MEDEFMSGLWLGGLGGLHTARPNTAATNAARNAESRVLNAQEEIRELRHQVERITLLNQALWELIREKAGLTDADLERMAQEIDMRDGQLDGKMGGRAFTCPTCHRVSNAKHYKCLYCGELFEKPVFG